MTSKVFVTTYGLYNAGLQFANDKTGYWIDCSDYDAELVFDSMLEQEQQLIDSDQVDVEIMFTDYEGFPSDLYSESGIDFDLIEQYENLDGSEQRIIDLLLEHGACTDITEALGKLTDCYVFEGDRGDYAREQTNNCAEIPEFLANHIDWDSMGRDMECGGNMFDIGHNEILIVSW